MPYFQLLPSFNVGEKDVGYKDVIVYLTNIERGGEGERGGGTGRRGGRAISHSLFMYTVTSFIILTLVSLFYEVF